PHPLAPREAQRAAQATYDVLAAFSQADLEPRLVRQGLQAPHAARHDHALFEANTAAEPAERPGVRGAVPLDVIHPLDAAPGMEEAVGQGAIVGQQEQPAALEIESADRIDPLAQLGEEVPAGGPAFGDGQGAASPRG